MIKSFFKLLGIFLVAFLGAAIGASSGVRDLMKTKSVVLAMKTPTVERAAERVDSPVGAMAKVEATPAPVVAVPPPPGSYVAVPVPVPADDAPAAEMVGDALDEAGLDTPSGPPRSDLPAMSRAEMAHLPPVPAGYFAIDKILKGDGADPRPIQVGQTILIEVLEALPGRPITGERIVRDDGTVSLGFYGDLKVAGLTRDQVKVKLLEHLRLFLTDSVLGLEHLDLESNEKRYVAPVDSDRVFVDDGIDHPSQAKARASGRAEFEALQREIFSLKAKADGIIQAAPAAEPKADADKPAAEPKAAVEPKPDEGPKPPG